MARYYESTCIDVPGSGAAFTIVSIPHPPNQLAGIILGAPRWPRRWPLGFEVSMEIPPTLLVPGLLAIRPDRSAWYRGDVDDFALASSVGIDTDYLQGLVRTVDDFDPGLLRFAARVAIEPLVPVEASPPHGVSLARLVGGGASATLGYMGAHSDPLLFLAVPAGIILVGGAQGIAEGLRTGLERRIINWLAGGVPDSAEEQEDRDDASSGESGDAGDTP